MDDLQENPFRLTGRTLEEEDELLENAKDHCSVSSTERSEAKPDVPRVIGDTICLSSDDDEEQPARDPPHPPPARRSIPEYFTPSKSAGKVPPLTRSSSKPPSAVASTSSARRKTPDSKQVRKVRRKICPGSNIKMLTGKYFDESQKRIENFFVKTQQDEDRVGYHTVVKASVMPAINTGDADVEKVLDVELVEEAEPLRPSQLLGPIPEEDRPNSPTAIMEWVERAQAQSFDQARHDINMELAVVPVLVDQDDSGISNGVPSTTMESVKPGKRSRKPAKTPAAKKAKVVAPPYKIIAGTSFAVDAFRYGTIEGVTHYFLTHYHSDHYIGLKKSFAHPLIMSPITARLVSAFINVNPDFYVTIQLHQEIEIDGVKVTALDANHCPGAVMFLFRLPNGTTMLHTGDFRASPEMEEYPEFWNYTINALYLDTTYLSTKYCFTSQYESICKAVAETKKFLDQNIGVRVLIVAGSYLIGKEKVWIELATRFNFRVWTEPNRRKALKAIGDPILLGQLVDDPVDAELHVLSMNKLTYDELVAHVDSFPDRFDRVLALRPSGWEKNERPRYGSRISIVGIEYSEHSSFEEMRRFVRYLRPEQVWSTVPYGNSNMGKVPSVPESWYRGKPTAERKGGQLAITSFVRVEQKKAKPEPAPEVATPPVVVVSNDADSEDDSDWM